MNSSDLPGKLKKFRACVLTSSTLTFSIGSYKWRVLLFPKGNNTNHMSIYLDVPDSAVLPYGWSRYAQFSLAVIDQIDNQNTVRKVEKLGMGNYFGMGCNGMGGGGGGGLYICCWSVLVSSMKCIFVNDATALLSLDGISLSEGMGGANLVRRRCICGIGMLKFIFMWLWKLESSKRKQHEFSSEESDWGFTSFMTLSELHDPSKVVLVNDAIIVEANFSSQSHDSKKETGHDNNSGDVDADITGISGGEVSLLESVRQDVAPPVGKEANRVLGLSEVTPVGDTFAIIQAGVHASTGQTSNNIRGHNTLLKNAVLDSKVNFLSYRVSSEAFLVLERIHNLHNDTFIKFSIKVSTIRVSDVNEDTLHRAAISIKDFELVGLNLSWLKQKLDDAKRVNKHSESFNFVEFYESTLQVAQAKVRKLEGGLANAKAELEIRSRDSPKSLGVDDYVLMDVA
ncbi:unnamed protein product [Camellia sinensis]